jgi:DNA-binding Xre family transcriptional regulator
MEVGKALRKVMLTWNLTGYQLSQVSGVHNTVIGKILNHKAKGVTWTTVERLANGLEKVDSSAKKDFLDTLALPDNALDEIEMVLESQKKRVKDISEIIVTLDNLNLFNRGAVDNLKENLQRTGSQITLEEFILMEMRNMFPRSVSEAEILKPKIDKLSQP